jgi:hypothetical protein
MVAALAGCATPAAPTELSDPCPLITEEMLQRLAPGAERVSEEGTGGKSGRKECTVDLESGSSSMRGDLYLVVSVDGVDMYDDKWRSGQCAKIGAKPTTAGPGDYSCFTLKPWADGEARIDGSAWVGDDYEVRVGYQLVEPRELPEGAEKDARDLLAAAVNALPIEQ